MPTHEEAEEFLQDLAKLTDAQLRHFRRCVQRFAQDLDNGGTFRASLRVKPVKGRAGLWELTWEGNDGRATFAYGPEHVPGKRHVIWERIGGHEIFTES